MARRRKVNRVRGKKKKVFWIVSAALLICAAAAGIILAVFLMKKDSPSKAADRLEDAWSRGDCEAVYEMFYPASSEGGGAEEKTKTEESEPVDGTVMRIIDRQELEALAGLELAADRSQTGQTSPDDYTAGTGSGTSLQLLAAIMRNGSLHCQSLEKNTAVFAVDVPDLAEYLKTQDLSDVTEESLLQLLINGASDPSCGRMQREVSLQAGKSGEQWKFIMNEPFLDAVYGGLIRYYEEAAADSMEEISGLAQEGSGQ